MIFMREFVVVYVLCIVYVCGFKMDTSPTSTTTSKPPRKCMQLSKNACDLCLDSGVNVPEKANFFSDTYAPAHCTSGIIEWHYPFGNGRVHFPINIIGKEAISICLRNGFSSTLIFNDITDKKRVLSNCTKEYHVSGEVVVHISGIGGEFTPEGVGLHNVYLQRANYTINTYRPKRNSGN